MKPAAAKLAFAAAAVLLWPIAFVTSIAGTPTIPQPLPLLVVIPTFLLSSTAHPNLLVVIASGAVPLLFAWLGSVAFPWLGELP